MLNPEANGMCMLQKPEADRVALHTTPKPEANQASHVHSQG